MDVPTVEIQEGSTHPDEPWNHNVSGHEYSGRGNVDNWVAAKGSFGAEVGSMEDHLSSHGAHDVPAGIHSVTTRCGQYRSEYSSPLHQHACGHVPTGQLRCVANGSIQEGSPQYEYCAGGSSTAFAHERVPYPHSQSIPTREISVHTLAPPRRQMGRPFGCDAGPHYPVHVQTPTHDIRQLGWHHQDDQVQSQPKAQSRPPCGNLCVSTALFGPPCYEANGASTNKTILVEGGASCRPAQALTGSSSPISHVSGPTQNVHTPLHQGGCDNGGVSAGTFNEWRRELDRENCTTRRCGPDDPQDNCEIYGRQGHPFAPQRHASPHPNHVGRETLMQEALGQTFKWRSGKRHLRSEVASAAQLDAPLHIGNKGNPVQCFDMKVIKGFLNPVQRQRLEYLLYLLEDIHLLHRLLDSEPELPEDVLMRSTVKDAQVMVNAQLCAPTTRAKAYLNIFTIYEEVEKDVGLLERRRVIMWPRRLIRAIRKLALYEFGQKFSTTQQDCAAVFHGPYCSTFDLAASFYQGQLAVDAQLFYCFRDEAGNSFAISRWLMGHVMCSEAMHIVLLGVAGHSDFSALPLSIAIEGHVDNVAFSGSSADVENAATIFKGRCEDAKITLNVERGNTASTISTYKGIVRNHSEKLVSLKEKSVKKGKSALLSITTWTNADLERAFGLLQFASTVLRLPAWRYYFAIKFFRRRMSALVNASQRDWETQAKLPPSALKDFTAWLQSVAVNVPVTPRRDIRSADVPITMFSDASLLGWGVVLIIDGIIFTVGYTWPFAKDKFHINILEAWAASYGIEYYLQAGIINRTHTIVLIIDSSSVRGAIRTQGGRGTHTFSSAVGELLTLLDTFAAWDTRHIKSSWNPADAPSRGSMPSYTLILQALGITCEGESV